MSTQKEFEGKTLDEAIESARAYFGVEREKLEVEIINDAQGGIFGLMGAKKAKIRAAKTQIPSLGLMDAPAESAAPQVQAERDSTPRKPRQEAPSRAPREQKADAMPASAAPRTERNPRSDSRPESEPRPERGSRPDSRPGSKPEARSDARPESKPESKRDVRAPRPEPRAPRPEGREPRMDSRAPRPERPAPRPRAEGSEFAGHADRDDLPDLDIAALDPAVLSQAVGGVVERLVQPIVGDVPITVSCRDGRVHVALDCGDASGLLVGRDGQTLAAIQYLASRISAKILGGNFRLFIDAGNYRERQEDKLRELALELADKACKTGRSQSTRPLSAYQRRIIHLALEQHQTVITCSKGDGLQRRVVVQPRRSRQDAPSGSDHLESAGQAAADSRHFEGAAQAAVGLDEAES